MSLRGSVIGNVLIFSGGSVIDGAVTYYSKDRVSLDAVEFPRGSFGTNALSLP
ncbi:hypothetical protein DPMN_055066 [Dreissena polymorpha]|uniref:Uncharacterized protein n=1 Tax=Dreissena polymorpha TaxID=45954 RepID=A0A9D4HTP7_DREPO|nr:hypothetical protein DPMN_055066 [Dreissena polymorpha]